HACAVFSASPLRRLLPQARHRLGRLAGARIATGELGESRQGGQPEASDCEKKDGTHRVPPWAAFVPCSETIVCPFLRREALPNRLRARLRSDTTAAIHDEHLTGDKCRSVRRQEERRADQVVGLTVATQGNMSHQAFIELLVLEQGGGESRLHQAWRQS